MSSESDNKTEEPTEKKRKEAFEKGTFAKAQEIGVVFVLAASFVIILFVLPGKVGELSDLTSMLLGGLHEYKDITTHSAPGSFRFLLEATIGFVFPLMLACFLAALLAGGLQTGFRPTPKVLEARADKLNPVSGLKRIFGKDAMVTAGIDLLKFIAIGVVLYFFAKQITKHPIFSAPVPIQWVWGFIHDLALGLLVRLIVIMAIIAVIQYLFQKHKTTKDLRMDKQEVKEENKQSHGNPEVKRKQKQMAFQLLQRQMLDAVPAADVVVTNPTHYAVALRYERGRDQAPIILAKGERLFAQRIKAIAAENGVPMVENVPVARMLFRAGRVGKTIPLELYQVVAEILAQVYKAHRYYFHNLKRRRMAGEGALPGEMAGSR